jgi:uncharacterized protein (TIGR02266 family)
MLSMKPEEGPALGSLFPPIVAPPIHPTEDADERRASPRIRLETDVSLVSDSTFFTGLSGNISEGGIFVATYRALPLGTSIELEFELPEGVVRAVGCVCWIRDAGPDSPPGMGIEFVSISNVDQEKIAHFCEVRPPLYYDL